MTKEPLPFADKSFDFVYCRHVVEDLYNPFLLLKEMDRVGKAGYIETPSPMCELTKGVDGGNDPPHRGYIHHRSFVWVEDAVLYLVEKATAVEHMAFDAARLLEANPFLWNTYFLWSGKLKFHFLEQSVHFTYYDVPANFCLWVLRGRTQSWTEPLNNWSESLRSVVQGEIMNTEQKNGNPSSMDSLKLDGPDNKTINLNDEAEFVKTFPKGQWLFCRREEPKKLSTVLEGFEIQSAFVSVLAVGPDFLGDVKPGDRVTYAECLGLPKELKVPWAIKYCWVHENKVLGRLPRNADDKGMTATGQYADGLSIQRAIANFVAEKTAEAHAMGMDVGKLFGEKPKAG